MNNFRNNKLIKGTVFFALLLMGITSKAGVNNPNNPAAFSGATAGDFVWLDRNNNGTQDAAEPGVQGIDVFLIDAGGVTISSTVTDAGGRYLFTAIDAGVFGKAWQIKFRLPSGFRFSPKNSIISSGINSDADENTGLTSVFTLVPGEVNTNIDAGLVNPASGTLPLHHLDLTVLLKGTTVTLNWMAENEMNTTGFIVEQSVDGVNYTDIGTSGVNGQANTPTNYSVTTDIQSPGIYSIIYYRIKAEDNYHRFAYSNVVPVRLNNISDIRVWPAPFVHDIRISYQCTSNGMVDVQLTDNTGKTAWKKTFETSRGLNQLSVAGVSQLPGGIYYIAVTDKNTGHSFTQLVVK